MTGEHHFNTIYPGNTFYLKFITPAFPNRRSCIFRQLLRPSKELSLSRYLCSSGESDVLVSARLCRGLCRSRWWPVQASSCPLGGAAVPPLPSRQGRGARPRGDTAVPAVQGEGHRRQRQREAHPSGPSTGNSSACLERRSCRTNSDMSVGMRLK